MNSWILTFFLATTFLLIFGIGEILFHFAKLKAELTRKLTHIASGLLCLSFPLIMESRWQVLAICASFAALLSLSKKYNLLQSINAVNRNTIGAFLFPLSVFVCYLCYEYFDHLLYFYIPILVMALCDPIAALVGKNYPKIPYFILGHQKTISGSAAFLLSSFLLIGILLSLFTTHFHWQISLFAALAASLAEAIGVKGYDNLSIPLSILLIFYFFPPL
jgi:phytol kinase